MRLFGRQTCEPQPAAALPNAPLHNPWAGFLDGKPEAVNNGTETVDSWSYTYFKWQTYTGNATGSNGRLYIDPETYGGTPLERTSAWYPAGGLRNWGGAYLGETGAATNLWGAAAAAMMTYITSTNIYPYNIHNASRGCSVRCLSK